MHTVERGQTRSQKWEGLGGSNERTVAHPSKISAFLVGLPGEGKSLFVQSMPDAYIINAGASSCVGPVLNATLWPHVDRATSLLMDQGMPVVLTWDKIADKVQVLKRLAVENKPRPETVVFDELSSMIRLLKSWMPPNAAKLGIASEPKSEWKDLHGPAAWDVLYDTLVNMFQDLRNHGYGVYVVGHVVNAKIPLGENQYTYKYELTITDGFWKRLYYLFEMSAVIYRVEEEERETKEVKTSVRGVDKIETRTTTRKVMNHYLSVQRLDLTGITKARVKLPEKIKLPEDGAWAAFERLYVEASKNTLPGSDR